jgi:diguanylate cyclase (GGDEF)-like protein
MLAVVGAVAVILGYNTFSKSMTELHVMMADNMSASDLEYLARIHRIQREYLIQLSLLILVLSLVFCVAYAIWVKKTLIIPMKTLAGDAERFMRDEIDPSFVLKDTSAEAGQKGSKDEFEQLSGTIRSMQSTIHKYIENLNIANMKASTDVLTGLYNRELLTTSATAFLTGRYADRCSCAFIMIDVDNFKRVNDSYGHMEGDMTLKQIANVLTGMFRPHDLRSGDTVARCGGDEFAVFCRNLSSPEVVRKKMQLLGQDLWAIKPGGTVEGVTVSVGIAVVEDLFSAGPEICYNVLYNVADRALYTVKERGRDGFEIINL